MTEQAGAPEPRGAEVEATAILLEAELRAARTLSAADGAEVVAPGLTAGQRLALEDQLRALEEIEGKLIELAHLALPLAGPPSSDPPANKPDVAGEQFGPVLRGGGTPPSSLAQVRREAEAIVEDARRRAAELGNRVAPPSALDQLERLLAARFELLERLIAMIGQMAL